MRFILTVVSLVGLASAFTSPVVQHHTGHKPTKTELSLQRRDLLITGILGLIAIPEIATAKGSTFFYDDKIEEKPVEQSQMPTGGKLDLNSAFVVSKI